MFKSIIRLKPNLIENILNNYINNLFIIVKDYKYDIKIKPNFIFYYDNGIFCINKNSSSYIDFESEKGDIHFKQFLEVRFIDKHTSIIFNKNIEARIYNLNKDDFIKFVNNSENEKENISIKCKYSELVKTLNTDSISQSSKMKYNDINNFNSAFMNHNVSLEFKDYSKEIFENRIFGNCKEVTFSDVLAENYLKNTNRMCLKSQDGSKDTFRIFINMILNNNSLIEIASKESGFYSKIKNITKLYDFYDDYANMSTNDKNIILELSNKKYFFEDEIAYDSCFDYFIQTGNYKEKDIFVYKTSDEQKINYLKKLVEDEERKRKKMDIDDCWEDEYCDPYDPEYNFLFKYSFIINEKITIFNEPFIIHDIELNKISNLYDISYTITTPDKKIPKNKLAYDFSRLANHKSLLKESLIEKYHDSIYTKEEYVYTLKDLRDEMDDIGMQNLINMLED